MCKEKISDTSQIINKLNTQSVFNNVKLNNGIERTMKLVSNNIL